MSAAPLNVLCIGDSLTEGFYGANAAFYQALAAKIARGDGSTGKLSANGGAEFGTNIRFHPYSGNLQQTLNQSSRVYNVVTDGISGDRADNFSNRLSKHLDSNESIHFDWVLILGGTNDTIQGVPAEQTYNVLQSLWNQAVAKGSKVLAMTVPEFNSLPDSLLQTRIDLNKLILGHKNQDIYIFDLESAVPYNALSEEDRKLYWDDHVHLTAEGYDWMGAHIAHALEGLTSGLE